MEKSAFSIAIADLAPAIDAIRQCAHKIHDDVNQRYDKKHPYGFHLDMVADNVKAFGAEVCASADDVAPLLFGAYFHDAIEDARLTYNDVLAIAQQHLDPRQALMATEIAYALTNEKGRTRAERANDRYYAGIRQTPYAPLVKLADRLANASYSTFGENPFITASDPHNPANVAPAESHKHPEHSNPVNQAMRKVYAAETPHFLEAITASAPDPRLALPPAMVSALLSLFADR